jgi:CDP-diacylglycerol---serine O-phosphatidyltransferase
MGITLPSVSVEKSDVNLIIGAEKYRKRLLSLIASAKSRIYIVALYLQDDEAGREVLHALYQAKQANPELDVKVFVDFHRAQRGLIGEAAQLGNRACYQALAKEYDHCIDIHGVAVKNKEFLGVLHLKGMVFDDKVFYTGASINNIYLQYEDKYRLDRYFEFDAKALADSFCNYLLSNLVNSGFAPLLGDDCSFDKKQVKQTSTRTKGALRRGRYQLHSDAYDSDASLQIAPLVGLGMRNNILNKTIVDLVKNSTQQIELYTPYFNLPSVLKKHLVKALKRGVEVKVVVGDKTANDFYIRDETKFSTIGIVPYLYESILQRFIKRYQKYIDQGLLKIHLWQDGENSYHLKGVAVDDRYHLITGSNINPRAWNLDVENGLLVSDPSKELLDMINQERAEIYQHAKLITHYSQIDTVADYPTAPQKLMKKIKLSKIDGILKRFL